MNGIILRFSAMGDVAMAAPVLKGVLDNNVELHLTVVSRPAFAPLFTNQERLSFFGLDLEKRHKGIFGLWRLALDLGRDHQFSYVFDLHNVLRSIVLCLFLQILSFLPFTGVNRIRIYRLDKGRREKLRLLKGKKPPTNPIKHMAQRYLDVFKKAGFSTSWPEDQRILIDSEIQNFVKNKFRQWEVLSGLKIGIAPFAKHNTKIWPIDRYDKLFTEFSDQCHFFLFGGGASEIERLKQMEKRFENVRCLAGSFTLKEELGFLSQMDLVISMDSANMHMAAYTGVPLLTIWGGTHPNLGFSPVTSQFSRTVEIEDLNCRPCSVFGRDSCPLGHFKCMEDIPAERVIKAVKELIAVH